MAAPLIGVTSTRTQSRYGVPLSAVAEAYTKAVAEAGAIPVLIPLGMTEAILDKLLSRLDGILFTGGGDIRPQQYGHTSHSLVEDVDTDRDRVELHLLQETLDVKQPFLGICRGIQVINVGLGGTLYEDILDQRPESLQHQHFPEMPRNYRAHPVLVEENSCLAHILETREPHVNSMHHQGIERLAPRLQATAFAPDGVIEAVELPDYPFGLAVQWHPEWLQDDPAMRKLFRAFVEAAEKT